MTPTRREFLVSGIYSGFALATVPISAWAITTSFDGMDAGSVEISTDGGNMPAYRAFPKNAKGPLPVILVVHEIFGVHEYIQDVCRRLAKEGYLAISPYLYFREGEVGNLKTIDEIRSQVVSKVKLNQAMKDLDSVVKWANAQPSQKSGKSNVGITGFCWGGTVTWLYSHHNPDIKAGVAWYGRVKGEHSENIPTYPLDISKELKVPVLGLYGGKDSGIPVADVDEMRKAVELGKSRSKLILYPEAEHGFHADYRPSYNESAAKEGWKKMLAWFRENGLKT